MPLTGPLDEETRREMDNMRDEQGRDINHRDYGRPSIFEDRNDD